MSRFEKAKGRLATLEVGHFVMCEDRGGNGGRDGGVRGGEGRTRTLHTRVCTFTRCSGSSACVYTCYLHSVPWAVSTVQYLC